MITVDPVTRHVIFSGEVAHHVQECRSCATDVLPVAEVSHLEDRIDSLVEGFLEAPHGVVGIAVPVASDQQFVWVSHFSPTAGCAEYPPLSASTDIQVPNTDVCYGSC